MGVWSEGRGTNLLDTGAHFYDVYETADGKYVSIGSIEPQFYAELLRLTGLEGEELPWQHDRSQWPALKERLAEIFKTKTRDEWCEIMEHTDVCFAPVLSLAEAPQHPHNVERGTFVELDGVVQPAPAPALLGDARRACSARRPTPASTPTRSSPSGASTPTASPSSARPAPSRSSAVASLRARWPPSSRSTPTPTTSRSPPAARSPRRPRPATARCSCSPRKGEHGEVRRRLPRRRRDARRAAGEGDRALGRDPRRPARRVARLHRLRDDGHARERPRRARSGRADVDEAAERLAAILREEDADVLTIYDSDGNYGHPDHIQVHRVGLRAAELAGTPRVFEGTINRDHIKRAMLAAAEAGRPPRRGRARPRTTSRRSVGPSR